MDEKSSPTSERVRESYDSLPGDSEAEVDYQQPSTVVGSEMADFDSPPVRLLHQLRQYNPEISMSQVGSNLKPELAVELVVTTPDGRRFSFAEAQEYETESDPGNPMIAEMIDQVYGAGIRRFAEIDG